MNLRNSIGNLYKKVNREYCMDIFMENIKKYAQNVDITVQGYLQKGYPPERGVYEKEVSNYSDIGINDLYCNNAPG